MSAPDPNHRPAAVPLAYRDPEDDAPPDPPARGDRVVAFIGLVVYWLLTAAFAALAVSAYRFGREPGGLLLALVLTGLCAWRGYAAGHALFRSRTSRR